MRAALLAIIVMSGCLGAAPDDPEPGDPLAAFLACPQAPDQEIDCTQNIIEGTAGAIPDGFVCVDVEHRSYDNGETLASLWTDGTSYGVWFRAEADVAGWFYGEARFPEGPWYAAGPFDKGWLPLGTTDGDRWQHKLRFFHDFEATGAPLTEDSWHLRAVPWHDDQLWTWVEFDSGHRAVAMVQGIRGLVTGDAGINTTAGSFSVAHSLLHDGDLQFGPAGSPLLDGLDACT